eukprot:3479047-Prymnesium_polylepis.1
MCSWSLLRTRAHAPRPRRPPARREGVGDACTGRDSPAVRCEVARDDAGAAARRHGGTRRWRGAAARLCLEVPKAQIALIELNVAEGAVGDHLGRLLERGDRRAVHRRLAIVHLFVRTRSRIS